MKRVLIIGSDFLPSTYPPALRIRLFAQHLPEFGWEPTVLTIDPKHYEWSFDPTAEQLIPKSLRVVRTGALSTGFTRRIGIGDVGLRSFWQHWRAASRICRDEQVDLVFIPIPPYYPAVLGRLLHGKYNVPYVIDYIDPWVIDDFWDQPRSRRNWKRRMSHRLSCALEPYATRHVAHIVAVDKSYVAGLVNRTAWLSDDDTSGIPYGGEPSDFESVRRSPRTHDLFDPHDEFVHLCYVGRGGHDMLPAAAAVFSALKAGLASEPDVFERVRIHFIGTTYAANSAGQHQFLPLAREFSLQSRVTEHPGRIPYLDAIQVLADSDALLILGSESTHYTASKVFPYILAKRPILAILHEASSAVDILRRTNAAAPITFGPERPVSDCAAGITAQLAAIANQPPRTEPNTNWEAFSAYTARSMTKQLSDVFDRVVEKCAMSSHSA